MNPETNTELIQEKPLDSAELLVNQAEGINNFRADVRKARMGNLAVALGAVLEQRNVESEEELTNIVFSLETVNYVREAPRLVDQVSDSSRENFLRYEKSNGGLLKREPNLAEVKELTEHEALGQFELFLQNFIDTEKSDGGYQVELVDKAEGMLKSLTFIGEAELSEAAKGLGALWKNYLDGDSARQLCVLAQVSGSNHGAGVRKSDTFVRDRVLDTFTDEELKKYSGRLVTEMRHLKSEPHDTKVVMIDDWAISGSELRDGYATLELHCGRQFKKYKNQVEINLITACKDKVENGLAIYPFRPEQGAIPVKAYYVAHDAPSASEDKGIHVTGAHSSVDFEFENDIARMVNRAKERAVQNGTDPEVIKMPPLTNIVRAYRYEKPRYYTDGAVITRAPSSEILLLAGR